MSNQPRINHRPSTRNRSNGRPVTAAGRHKKSRFSDQSPAQLGDDSDCAFLSKGQQAIDEQASMANIFLPDAGKIAGEVEKRAPPPRRNAGARKTKIQVQSRTGGTRSKNDRRYSSHQQQQREQEQHPLFEAVASQGSKPSGCRQPAGGHCNNSNRPRFNGLEQARQQQQFHQDIRSANHRQGRTPAIKSNHHQKEVASHKNGRVPQQPQRKQPQQLPAAAPQQDMFAGDRIPRKPGRKNKAETVNLCDDEDSRTDSSSPVEKDNKNVESSSSSSLRQDDTVDLLHDSPDKAAAMEEKQNLSDSNNGSRATASSAAAPKGGKGGKNGSRSTSAAPGGGKGGSSEDALLVDSDDEHGGEKQQEQQQHQSKQHSGDKRRASDDNAETKPASKRAKKTKQQQKQNSELDFGSSEDEVEAETEPKKKKAVARDDGDDGGQRIEDALQQIETDGSRVEDVEEVRGSRRGGMLASLAKMIPTSLVEAAQPMLSLSKAPPKGRNGRGNVFGSAGAGKGRGKPILPGMSLRGTRSSSSNNNNGTAVGAAPSTRRVPDIVAERKAEKEKKQKKRPPKQSNEFDSEGETEWHPASESFDFQRPKRTTRSQSKKRKKKDASKEVIEIDSSGDEEDSPVRTVKSSSSSSLTLFAIRISIGKKVEGEDCKVSFAMNKKPTMTISHKSAKKTRSSYKFGVGDGVSYKIDLENDLLEMKHFLDTDGGGEDEITNFLSLRIEKNAENGLSKFSNKYDPESPELEKRYLVIEFRDEEQFADILAEMQACKLLQSFMDGSVLSKDNRQAYCRVLEQDSEKQRRTQKRAKGPRTDFLTGKGDEDTLLVYPFGGDANEIDKAALDLDELSFCLHPDPPLKAAAAKDADVKQQTDEVETTGNAILGIKVVDYERLDPPEYLNDTLIDFWMQWVTRNSDISDIHIFTTHFYTTLAEEGVDAVKNWTQKKKRPINVFQKKLIFIPINKGLHWSLCIVVNPGAISNLWELSKAGPLDDKALDSSFPCLLFLDSLKMHNMQNVGNIVRSWLNSEWKRLNPESTRPKPFIKKSMVITSPVVPRQLNAYDCGVFVCRYAYGFLCIRSKTFSYRDAGIAEVTNEMHRSHKSLFRKSITEDKAFVFGMEDIDRIREEMKTLIKRLSNIYIPFQQEQDRQKKEDRKARKLAKQKADEELKENTEADTNIVVHNPAEAVDSASSAASQKPAAQPTDGADSLSSSESQKPAAQPTESTGAADSNGDDDNGDDKVETVEGELATLNISNANSSENSAANDPVESAPAEPTIPMDIDSEAEKDEAETLSASATTNAPPEEVPADAMGVEKDEANANELVEPTTVHMPSVECDVGSEDEDEQLEENQAKESHQTVGDKSDATADEEVEEDV